MTEYTVNYIYQNDEPESLPPLDWFNVGVPMNDKSVPEEPRAYLKARGWTLKKMERARLRYVPGSLIAERWRRSTVRDAFTAQAGNEKPKKSAKAPPADRYRPTGGIALPFTSDYGVIRVFYHVEQGEPKTKYVMPGREPARILIPHHMRTGKALAGGRQGTPAEKLAPLVIVEGYLKAELAASYGIPCLGINGCHGWRVSKAAGLEAALNGDSDYEPAIRPEILEHWPKGRGGILQTDGDHQTNLNVRAALLSFVDLAREAGCVPLVRPLPEATGIDDWLASGHSQTEFDALPTYGAESPCVRKLRAPFCDLDETGLGDRFVAYFGEETFYDSEAEMWFALTPKGWREGDAIPKERMQEVTRSVKLEALAEKNVAKRKARSEFAGYCARNHVQNAALSQAIRSGKIRVDAASFDADPNLLGVRNGILDLSTHTLHPRSREFKVTKSMACDYDPTATAPLFLKFIDNASGGDADFKRHVQEVLGASLLGRAIRTQLHVWWGEAFTGRSVFLEVALALHGDYGLASKADMLLRQYRVNSQGPQPFLRALRGRRLVTCSELNEGVAFDDALVKDLCGGDTITARGLHENQITFKNTATIWIRSNHPPLMNPDSAMLSRVLAEPFKIVIPEGKRDKTLADKIIATELSGVLNWALVGMRAYVKRGMEFKLPAAVIDATRQMAQNADVVGSWLSECIEEGADKNMEWNVFFQSYRTWCAKNGHINPRSSMSLKGYMRRRYKLDEKWPHKSNGKVWAKGFASVKDPAVPDPAEEFATANKALADELAKARERIAILEADNVAELRPARAAAAK